jgi:hypothetical protein
VPWAKVLESLVVSRLVAPGSEFRLHRRYLMKLSGERER